jgi:hypothetical protein
MISSHSKKAKLTGQEVLHLMNLLKRAGGEFPPLKNAKYSTILAILEFSLAENAKKLDRHGSIAPERRISS